MCILYKMGIEELVNYVNTKAKEDMDLIKPLFEKLITDASSRLLTGTNTNKKYGGSTNLNTRTNARNTNARNMITRKNAVTNKNPTMIEENKFKISLLFSLVILCALSHLRGVTPFIHSFMELLAVYKTDAYNRVIVPFMTMTENTFSFLKTTLLPNIKEGIYTKTMNTLNGTDFLNDPNKVIATQVNLSKVYLFAVSIFAKALNMVYTPSVKVTTDPDEIKKLFKEILDVLNEKFKGLKGFTFMSIPAGSILMTHETTPLKDPSKEMPKM